MYSWRSDVTPLTYRLCLLHIKLLYFPHRHQVDVDFSWLFSLTESWWDLRQHTIKQVCKPWIITALLYYTEWPHAIKHTLVDIKLWNKYFKTHLLASKIKNNLKYYLWLCTHVTHVLDIKSVNWLFIICCWRITVRVCQQWCRGI
jgi:hypothetical protein